MEDIRASVKLDVQDVLAELDFLLSVDQRRELYEPDVVRKAVHRWVKQIGVTDKDKLDFRYERFWLPVLQQYSNNAEEDLTLEPPEDVKWVWHVHLLAPNAYSQDMKQSALARIPSFNLKPDKNKQRKRRAKNFWEELFPDEPYEAKADQRPEIFPPSDFSYDIVAAAERQKVFFYQVSLPHYRDEDFLKSAIRRYHKYLLLQQQNPNEFLVPCYDMDIVWHTHQIDHLAYVEDTLKILGRVLNHDDSVNNREPGSKLSNSSEVTQKLWRTTFGEDFRQPGCMYRGPPPQGCLKHLSVDTQRALLNTRVASIRLRHISCTLPQGWFNEGTVKKVALHPTIKFKNSIKNFPSSNEINIPMKLGRQNPRVEEEWSFEDSTPVAVNECNLPSLTMRQISSRVVPCCFCLTDTKKEYNNMKPVDLFPFPEKEETRELEGDHNKGRNIRVAVEYTKLSVEPKDMVFSILPGTFYDCVIPETVSSLWGPIPLERLPDGVDNSCRAVTHGIVNTAGEKVMSVYLIHSLPLVLSAVQVFVGPDMAVIAHTVGPDTIGRERMLELENIFEKVPWRAMLIKDNDGDFGICVAGWVGMRRGVPGVPGTSKTRGVPGKPGDHGHFKMVFLNLRTDEAEVIRLPNLASGSMRMEAGQLKADWDDGKLLVRERGNKTAQHVALAFATSTLYLLVQPRPEDLDKAKEKWDEECVKQKIPMPMPPFLRNAGITFLLYTGWKESKKIPSNSTISYERRRRREDGYNDTNVYWMAAGCWGFGYGFGINLGADDDGVTGEVDVAGCVAGDGDGGGGDGGGVDIGGCGGCGGCGGGGGDGGGLFGGGGGDGGGDGGGWFGGGGGDGGGDAGGCGGGGCGGGGCGGCGGCGG